MRRHLYLWLMMGFIILSQAVFAATPTPVPPLRVGILDIDKVLHESKVGLFIQDQVEKKRTELQKEVESHEGILRNEEKELKDLQADPKTPPDVLHEKQTAFEKKVDGVQKQFNAKSKDLEETFNAARAEVVQAIMKLVSEIADEQKITLVVPKNIVMFRDDAYEFTEELMKRLDKRLPTVDIKIPKKS